MNPDLSLLLQGLEGHIESVRTFRLDVEAERHFSHGVWRGRQHVVLRLGAGEHRGWGECVGATSRPDFDLAAWSAALEGLNRLAWNEVAEFLFAARDVWPAKQLEMTEMAVLDLVGRLKNVSVLEMLGLDGRAAIAGLFCILESDPNRAAERARFAMKKNLKSHAKVKIFGKPELDCAVIAAVRREMGPRTYLCADANGGYTSRREALVSDMKTLRAASLDACEDPASLTVEEWVELQSAVGELDLIPDAPLRPAWKARQKIVAGMGRIYNIHPGTSGSLVEAARLARQIQGFGARMIVGDDSLVGPGCTAWQQMAIGLGAAWCEALEKSDESDVFLRCVRAQNTHRLEDGRFGIGELRPGFGLDVDAMRLETECASVWC